MSDHICKWKFVAVALIAFGLPAFAAQAQDSTAKPSIDQTGSWRSRLANHGLTMQFQSTHFYQGEFGGNDRDEFAYGGRADAFLNLDTGKAGMWQGGLIRVHAEYLYDDLDSSMGETLLPTNLGATLPLDAHKLVATSIHLVQKVGERSSVILGKINTVDLLAADPFFGGYGVDRFQHLAFTAPPSGLTPPVIFGGIFNVKTERLGWTFMAYDPNNRPKDYWPDDLFGDGINMAATAKKDYKLAGRRTSWAAGAIYSSKDGASLEDVLLPPDLKSGDKGHSWHASFQFSHFLKDESDRILNFTVKGGVSDGNPNPFQGFVIGGVAGTGLFAARPEDMYGVGYFYYNLSNDLQNAVHPLVKFKDEQGVEAFYAFKVTDWLRVSADLQYVDPAIGASDKALVAGLRLVLKL